MSGEQIVPGEERPLVHAVMSPGNWTSGASAGLAVQGFSMEKR